MIKKAGTLIKKNAPEVKKATNSVDYDMVKSYLKDITDKTGCTVQKLQLDKLKAALRKSEYTKLSVQDSAKHRREFTTKVKNDCIKQWEINTGQTWPRYTENIYSKNGTVVRNIGDPYDAHHIIESSYNGNHEWWNITPAKFPDEHQNGIHRKNSTCNNLFK